MRWILATDATPTTGNFGLLKVDNIHYLTGHSHKYNEPTKVNLRNNGETDVVVLEDGTINGLEVFPKLKALDIVEKQRQFRRSYWFLCVNLHSHIVLPRTQ